MGVVCRVLVVCVVVVIASEAILVRKMRRKIEPDSNIVPSSRFQFPIDHPEPCKTDLSLPGLCVDVRHCIAARYAIRAGNHPVRCGWREDLFTPMVCCHPDQVRHPKIVFRPNRRRSYYHYDVE